MNIEQIDLITKQNEPSGSNYPSGYRQGNFFLPNEGSQGVPVAMVHPYVANNIPGIPNDPILTVPITGTGSFYLKLGNITPLANGIEVVYPQNTNSTPYLDLYLPRKVSVLCEDPGTSGEVIFSGEDQYENPMVWSQNLLNVYTNIGRVPKKIFAAYVNITTFGVPSNLTLNLTNAFELPFTDYGMSAFNSPLLLSVTYCDTAAPESPTIALTSTIPTTSFKFDIVYSQASWTNPLTINTGQSRPEFIFSNLDEDPVNWTIWLVNFGFQNTQFIKQFINPIASIYQGTENEEEYYVYGIPQYVDENFTTWQG